MVHIGNEIVFKQHRSSGDNILGGSKTQTCPCSHELEAVRMYMHAGLCVQHSTAVSYPNHLASHKYAGQAMQPAVCCIRHV